MCMAVQELGEVSGKHLLPGFGEEEDDHEETIASTVQEITGLFKECERRLKEIHNAENDGSGDEVCCRGEGTPRKKGWPGVVPDPRFTCRQYSHVVTAGCSQEH